MKNKAITFYGLLTGLVLLTFFGCKKQDLKFTLDGKRLYFRENINSQTEVNLTNEANGVYLLKVSSNEKIVNKKIVVTN